MNVGHEFDYGQTSCSENMRRCAPPRGPLADGWVEGGGGAGPGVACKMRKNNFDNCRSLSAMHSAKFANMHRKTIDVPSVGETVRTALQAPSSCVPDHAVMLSMATTHHMKLRHAQFAKVKDLECFMTRMVSVCYGFTDSYGRCVYGSCNKSLGLANPCLPSDYRRSQYVALNWAKWPLFIDSLRVARSALWLEADVVILRNPWALLLSDAQRSATLYDAVRYQFEAPPCTLPQIVKSAAVACSKDTWPAPHPDPLNCGQLLLNSLDFALVSSAHPTESSIAQAHTQFPTYQNSPSCR